MLTSIQIENFRCFDYQFKLEKLNRVNLLAGKNNIGKTSLLEAINLLAAGASPHAIVSNPFRRSPQVKLNKTLANSLLFQPLFNRLHSSTPRIKIKGSNYYGEHSLQIDYAKSKTLSLDLAEHETLANIAPSTANNKDLILRYSLFKHSSKNLNHPNDWNHTDKGLTNRLTIQENSFVQSMSDAEEIPINCSAIPAHIHLSNQTQAELLGKAELAGKLEAIVSSLRILEPRLENLTTIVMGGVPILYADLGYDRLLPFSVLGEGIYRLFTFLLAIINTQDGIVLIDEIENGIHHSITKQVWSLIGQVSEQYKVQVIATTHSYECIEAAHAAFSETDRYDFQLHRIDRLQNRLKTVTYDQETLETALKIPFEVR